jgi:hypothetical protein
MAAPLVRAVGFASLRLGAFFARPSAGELSPPMAAAVIDEAADEAEHRALDQQRGQHLDQWDLAVLGVRGLFVVDEAPLIASSALSNSSS